MDFKKEIEEYINIYGIFVEDFKVKLKESEDFELKIAQKDKEDNKAQRDSKEKTDTLEKYNAHIWTISMLKLDLNKIADRVIFLNELALRNGVDLELSEENKKFLTSLNVETPKLSFVVDSTSKKVVSKDPKLEQLIAEKVRESGQTEHILNEIRGKKFYIDA